MKFVKIDTVILFVLVKICLIYKLTGCFCPINRVHCCGRSPLILLFELPFLGKPR